MRNRENKGHTSEPQKRRLRDWTTGRAVAASVLAVFAFYALQLALFHSGWYNKYLEPNSTTGQVEYRLFWLRRTWPAKVPDILVVGDSRVAEGFSAPVAGASVGGRLHFVNWGMPGTPPRVWYYALRDMEEDRNRFSAIVIEFDRYSDLDGTETVQDRAADLNYLAGRLSLGDCLDFARSYSDSSIARTIFTGCIFRGIPLRADVRQFLSDISARREHARVWRNRGAEYVNDYDGKSETLAGLTFDAANRRIDFPPGMSENQIATVKGTITPDPAPQTGALTAYRRKWIGGILDLYRNSPTRIVFIQIPNAPLPLPDSTAPARFIDSVRGRRGLSVLPPDAFKDLQRPEFFADGLHLNSKGRILFSAKLAKELEPVMERR
ncbi:MAG: hypothetical protein KGN84_05885 [Acidobacteriota bacterium]|nr:hypothetical protein [Acidobacteriota bacterium]